MYLLENRVQKRIILSTGSQLNEIQSAIKYFKKWYEKKQITLLYCTEYPVIQKN